MIRVSALVLALTALLFPSITYADSFNALNGATIFQSRDHAYRIRSAVKPPQLSELGGLGGPSKLINETLFTFFDGKLHRSVDGLSYQAIEIGGVITEPQFITSGDEQLLFARLGGGVLTWRLAAGGWQKVNDTPLANLPQNQIGYLGGRVTLVAVVAGQLTAFVLNGNNWAAFSSVGCGGVESYFNTVRLGAVCTDGSSWGFNGLIWESLAIEPVTIRGSSGSIILASSLTNPDRVFVFSESTVETIDLPSVPTSYFTAGRRVLIGLGTAGLHELVWQSQPPELVAVATAFTGVVEASGGNDEVLVSAGSFAYLSNGPGIWGQLTAVGDFTRAIRVPTGIWVWQTNHQLTSGGLAQYLPTGQTNLMKVNPWSSTTSPIQATQLTTLPAYVSVITSSGSGNVNLYRSDNFLTWSRITLPTAPTLVRTIRDTRELSAGSLVETNGTVSVAANIVSGDVIYIQDSTGGIQVFLSSTKGLLGHQPSTAVRVTGEVSTSQTKRIILDAADDILTIGSSSPASAPPVDYLLADQYLGSLVSLSGKVAELSTDELLLTDDFRFQFAQLGQNLKSLFKVGDVIEAIAVVDWNSSTDQVEAWYVGRGFSVIERAPSSVATKTTKNSDKKPSTIKAGTTASQGSKSSSTQTASSVAKTAAIRPLVQGASKQVQVTTNTNDPLPAAGLTFLGIITGMLAVQGRRFQALIRS